MHAARDGEHAAFAVGVQVAEDPQRCEGQVQPRDEFLIHAAVEDAAQDADFVAEKVFVTHRPNVDGSSFTH